MSEIKTLAMREILSCASRAQSELFTLCREQNLDGSIRDSAAGKLFSNLNKIQSWSEAILKEKS